jgi:asparagine synthase (glutamine-hydrolysing)
MCGISLLWGKSVTDRVHAASLEALKPRGPDVTEKHILDNGVHVGFVRLHIQGARGGAEQPFRMSDGRLVLCNGEIFNSNILISQLNLTVPEGSSDCAVIPALLERGMSLEEVARQLDGDFAIAVIDKGYIHLARDPYGVRPLFYGSGNGWSGVVSELKGFPRGLQAVEQVHPGTVVRLVLPSGIVESVTVWHEVPWLKTPYWRTGPEALKHAASALRNSLEEAVTKRLNTVRDIGACLSGGLDSSLVAALAAKKLGKRLHTYSIGMDGSPDLEYARMVAAHIDSTHHEKIVTPEECLAVIPEVIKAIETFDITTVRASVGNYLVGKLVREVTPSVKVILNGDGSDEVLGGYLYMREAPDDAAFELETDRLLREIYRYDVLRSERSMAAHGLESRSPFLDRQFVSVARSLPTDALRHTKDIIEKRILRLAFADTDLLPVKVLWRRKEAFSDGISRSDRSWFEMAREEGERQSGGQWKSSDYVVNPPPTAEAYWYRRLFHEHYPAQAAEIVAPAMWMPRFIEASDPSARTLNLYNE